MAIINRQPSISKLLPRSFLRGLVGLEVATRPDNIPAGALARWLTERELGPLAYSRCRQSWPELTAQLQGDYFTAIAENSLHQEALGRMLAAFAKQQIPVVLLKGVAVATYYPNPVQRTMSDVDVWAQPEAISAVVTQMKELGFLPQAREGSRPESPQPGLTGKLKYGLPKWQQGQIEIHTYPFTGSWLARFGRVNSADIWQNCRPITLQTEPALLPAGADLIIHAAVHLAINHQFDPTTMRGLIDVLTVAQNEAINWPALLARAAQWRLATAVWLVLDLMERLFEWPIPPIGWQPSAGRRALLRWLVRPEGVLSGRSLSQSLWRYPYLLLLIDSPVSQTKD